MPAEKLSRTFIDALQPKGARYYVCDGKGLYLVVMPNGVKRWGLPRQMAGRPH